ncbi:patatin-like phospholipase family protein [Gilvimarinus agarilyticus]|uniref:patatin-like phospholipase family protein n=1 Tax=unclassified Gilvimarinus TaxID=2642066 RepID=UPI001C09A281|nr:MULTISPECIES: patatin-like phospholipase family protein [unclassified Gilvimarinus]MBU2884772.1 patatin-like phospholipase family protein [Gilvimarinus agarilyticus]MDO6569822.1 patatin-like phospholipase family protein [Gilvimarinus sp. 2_MG-2023]MDO6747056.1 patatin-like phospholipase family protein [Gilvimarinus sp. 1_MG-2023]
MSSKTALILSGGGARAAYQVGVLQALADILPEGVDNPFPVICGTSAGAINAVALASHPGNFREAIADLAAIWHELSINQVYRHGWADMLKGLSRIGFSLFNEGVGRHRPLSLLDNTPLWELLGSKIHFANIGHNIAANKLHAVSITAMGYTSGQSVSFFQGRPELEAWQRFRRAGVPTDLRLEHLLASSAIPTIFPTVRINREYFGDGALRQLAPMSPALHLGADALFVIGVSGNRNPKHWGKRVPVRHSPSMAQIVGHLLNSAFIDALENDIEHMERLNTLLEVIPPEVRQAQGIELRPVRNLVVSPSKAVDVIAGRKIRYLPRSVRFFLRAIGATAKGGGATAASYLSFSGPFISELIELGYQDTMWESARMREFFTPTVTSSTTD